ncbi:MAG: cupin domain-containing protein [Candidatus Kapaibacterium sp.]
MQENARNADFWIEELNLQPHPEGGFFAEVYRSEETIPESALPERFGGDHSFSTSIYYLLRSGEISRLHRLRADEVWHFYDGAPLNLVVIENGNPREIRLGRDPRRGELLQAVMPRGSWFGAWPAGADSYSLVGCTVAPGFEFEDLEFGDRAELVRDFPESREIVLRLTRG